MTERCAEVRAVLPELALGVAAGDERASALAHIVTCAECRTRLEETADVVDELLLLAPEVEPPPGFEARVLAAMDTSTHPRRRHPMWLAAAAAVVVVALGALTVTRWADADDRRLADQYRQTLEVADGSYLRAADLVDRDGSTAGHVFAYEGKPSWVFMTVEDAPAGTYDVSLVTDDGLVHDIGRCWVRDGKGSWGTSVDVPVSAIDRVEMRSGDEVVLASTFMPRR